MTTQGRLKQYHDWILKYSVYRMISSTIGIDKQTVVPSAGTAHRDKQSSYLAGEFFSLETDPEIVVFLKELKNDPAVDAEAKRAVQLYYKSVMDTMCVSKEEFVAYQKLCNESFGAWILAKLRAGHSTLKPYLEWITEDQEKLYGYHESNQSVYDQMLDGFEPGVTQEEYDAFFTALKERLVPLIRKVTTAKQIREGFLHLEYPVEEQKKFMNELLTYLHFDPLWGYQNESEHPFTSSTCENSCRTTIKYIPNNVVSAIFPTVYEIGHAYYEHNVDPKYGGTILSEDIPSGVHESQPRFCENRLAWTGVFWHYHYLKLKAQLPRQLGDVSLEDFLKVINTSKPSFIRTEMDELTYPMHVLIRHEIEKGLFNGTTSTEGLGKTQSVKYKECLGVDVPNAKVGTPQDVYWSDGNLDYFPTYTLGTAFAVRFVHTIWKELGVDKLLENNQYDVVMGQSEKHICKYGCHYNASGLMRLVTGEDFGINYFLDYVEEKYTKLYQLQEKYRLGNITEQRLFSDALQSFSEYYFQLYPAENRRAPALTFQC